MSTTSQKYGTIITDSGVNKVFVATTEGKKVNVVTIAAGDGGGAYYLPTKEMTELKNEVWRGAIGAYEVNKNSSNMITARGVIPADVGGFTIRELALFTDDDTMIAIANTADIEKVLIESGIIGKIEVSMNIVLTNAGTLNFVVDSSTIMATAEDLENHNEDPEAHKELFALMGGGTVVSPTMPTDFPVGMMWWKIPDTTGGDIETTDPEVTDPEVTDPEVDSNVKEVVALDLVDEEMPLNVVIDGVTMGISNAEEQTSVDEAPLFKISRK
ncbi:MAG: phage tail protein [Eubacteriales bacterium]